MAMADLQRLLDGALDPLRLGVTDRAPRLLIALEGDQVLCVVTPKPLQHVLAAVEVDVEHLEIPEPGLGFQLGEDRLLRRADGAPRRCDVDGIGLPAFWAASKASGVKTASAAFAAVPNIRGAAAGRRAGSDGWSSAISFDGSSGTGGSISCLGDGTVYVQALGPVLASD